MKIILFVMAVVTAFPMVVRLVSSCAQGGAGKNGATVANTSVVFPLFPISLLMLLCITIANKSSAGLFHHHQCLYVAAFGMSTVKITNKRVVAHLTKSELTLLDNRVRNSKRTTRLTTQGNTGAYHDPCVTAAEREHRQRLPESPRVARHEALEQCASSPKTSTRVGPALSV